MPSSADKLARLSALLDDEAASMGRPVTLMGCAYLPPGVLAVTYRLAPLDTDDSGKMTETRYVIDPGLGQGRTSGVVSTEWDREGG